MISNVFSSIVIKFRRSLRRFRLSTSTIKIEDLPPEMISELFKHLGPEDLIVCSFVNKRWYSIFARFKLHRLAVLGNDPDFERDHFIKWSYPNRRVEEVEKCGLWLFRYLAEKPLLSNLSYLILYGEWLQFDLNKLNRFEKLVHLEMNTHLGGKVHLNLPRLKVLAFYCFHVYDALLIDCPQLSTLIYYSGGPKDLLEVKHPETIRKLDTNLVDPEWLASFKSVACLVTREFEAISLATLLSLPRLKELRYDVPIKSSINHAFADHPTITIDGVKRTVSKFVDKAKKLRGSDFRLTFCGFDLTNVNLNQIDFAVHVDVRTGREHVFDEYVYLKNYQLIEPGALHFVSSIDYTSLLSVNGRFPRCFSQKFTGIQWVLATAEVPCPKHFLLFLSSLRSLKRLWLESTGFTQEFYDQLPASAHSLIYLHLREGHCKDGLQLNFDFIGRVSHLSELEIDPAVSLESATSLVRGLGKIGELAWCVFPVQSNEWDLKFEKPRHSTKWKAEGNQLIFESKNLEMIVNVFQ